MLLNRFLGLPLCAAFLLAVSVPAEAASFIPSATGFTVSVRDMGARGDGFSDDRPAIQAAVSLVESRGGGIVTIPPGTYLLNSYAPSPHPWFFYNIRVGSNVLLQGSPGARFLQGPGGRAPLQQFAGEVRNSVLVFGSVNYVTSTFQSPAYNHGFYSLQPTTAGSTVVSLSSPVQAQQFAPGNYVAIYSATAGDVIPSESSQVVAVNAAAGTLTLRWPLARAFQSPSIANVTHLASYNLGVTNLIVQGTEPLAVNETFNFSAENCQFISDLTVSGANTYGLNMNTMRDFRFTKDQISSVGPSAVGIELPQRNSQNGVIEASTFAVRYLVFGEYAAHWNLSGNNIMLSPMPGDPAMMALGGLDVTFANNSVTGSGTMPVLADYLGLPSYAAFVGQMVIVGNTFTCRADNSNCLSLSSPSVAVINNLIVTAGNAVGIKVEGPLPQVASIQQNSITVQTGLGVVINTVRIDQSNVVSNTVTGSGAPVGIIVATTVTPNTGGNVITGNCISGFNTPISVNMTNHPGTVVTNTATICPNVQLSNPAQPINPGVPTPRI